MSLINGMGRSMISISIAAVGLGVLLKNSKNILTNEKQANITKIANIMVLTSGLVGFYNGYYSKNIFPIHNISQWITSN